MAANLFKVGQVLRGRFAQYTITKQIYRETVWFAKKNCSEEQVVIKSVSGHPRVKNERDILQIFAKNGSPLLRSMIDEIQEPAEPVTIVLEYLDTDLDVSSREKTLSRQEVKYVAKKVLQALEILHDKGYVHTDVKLMNILANTSNENPSNRFSSIKLADFGETFHIDSKQAKEAMPISSAIWRSPEAQLQVDSGWNTATDIWSFGLCVISLILGKGIHLITPKVDCDHEDYEFQVLQRQYMFFGPIPSSYDDQVEGRPELQQVFLHMFEITPPDQLEQFRRIAKHQISDDDKAFLQKCMKWDWRDRPTVKELLEDEWFKDVVGA